MIKIPSDEENIVEENAKIWEKIRTIRDNWNNPGKLAMLLAEWEEIGPSYGPDYNERASWLVGLHTRKNWAEIAINEASNTVDDLLDILWESLRNVGGEYTVEKTNEGVQIYCTRCPIADKYRSISKERYGFLFHCVTDPHITAGFCGPDIGFQRTKTLMEGDDCCDHYYAFRKE